MRQPHRFPRWLRALALTGAVALVGAPLTPAWADHHEKGPEEGSEAEASAEPRAEETADEAALRAEVDQELRRNQFVEQYDIRPEVEGTTVTLRGAVSASHEKEKAAEIARGVDGVEDVDNQLLVGDVGDEADVGTMTEPQRRGRALQ